MEWGLAVWAGATLPSVQLSVGSWEPLIDALLMLQHCQTQQYIYPYKCLVRRSHADYPVDHWSNVARRTNIPFVCSICRRDCMIPMQLLWHGVRSTCNATTSWMPWHGSIPRSETVVSLLTMGFLRQTNRMDLETCLHWFLCASARSTWPFLRHPPFALCTVNTECMGVLLIMT